MSRQVLNSYPGRVFLSSLLLCFLPWALPAQVGPALDSAEAWLIDQQNLDGSLGTVPEFVPRDSAVTVLALAGRPASQDAVDRSAAYLANVPEENTQFRSRRALGLAQANLDPTAILTTLGQFKNGGGMGAFGEHQSNLLDTAFAIQAFALDEGGYLFDIVELLDYLQDHRNLDGGWGFVPGSSSEVYFSGETLATLAGLEQLAIGQQVLDDAANFLRTRQLADGSLGDVLNTAVGWRGLLDAGESDADFSFGSPLSYLLGSQLANGSWDDDVFTTAQVVRVLRLQAPNLIISALEAVPSSTVPGTPVLVQATVKNLGPEAAGSSHVAVRLDAFDGQLLAEEAVAALAVGEETTVTLTVDTSSLTASADLFAVADSQEELAEANESDNSDSVRLTLRTGPDLALFPSDLAVVPEQPQPDTNFPLQITARNLGESDVVRFEYRVSAIVGGSMQDIATGSAGPLAAGAATVIEVTLNLPEGEHTVEVTLDHQELLDEEIETNNDSTLSFFVVDPSQADLAILPGSIVLTPSEPLAGSPTSVDITVSNLGSRDATADLVLYENDPDEGGGELDRSSVTVPAGDSVVVNRSVTFSSTGHSLTVWADPDGEVLELDEVNNRRQEFFRQLPDLALGFDNLEVTPIDPLDGDPVTVDVTVRNGGTSAAQNVEVVVYDADPASGGSVIFSDTLADLDAASNRRLTFSWTATGGLNNLVALADPNDTLLELSESNNRTERAVAVPRGSGPDLLISALDASALVQSAETLALQGTLDLTLTNNGDVDVSTPFAVRLFEDRDGSGHHSQGEPVLASIVVNDAMTVGTSLLVSLPVDASTDFFHALVWAEVDAGDVVAEQREDNNLRTVFEDCESAPPAGSLEPIESWYRSGLNVETAPLVLQLSDDNDDGLIDSRDTPDIVFHTTDSEGIAIRAISGLDGSDVWAFRSSVSNPLVDHLGQLAAADIDGDGRVEIIGHQRNGRLIALQHNGALAWVSDRVPGVGNRGLGGPAIGDLDGDGIPEIVVGRAVVSNTGQLIAVGTGNNGENINYYGPFGVVKVPGANSYPQAAIADVDLDGINEVVAGDTVYRLVNGNLEIVWNATVPDNLMRDGWSAVGNLDGDPEAEIVYVSSDQIMVLNHNGSVRSSRRLMEPFSIFEMPTFWGGAPTIANLDGVGTPEILVYTATHVRAYSSTLSLRWKRPINPDFGGFTGVTAFDLDGDGVMEVLFNDEQTFYILNGANGQVLHSQTNRSFTAMEYPVVADATGDGRVDIVLPSSRPRNRNTSTMGIHLLSHPSWQGTRPMWNQYGYSVTNIALDGTVPSPMTPAWQLDNVYRGNRVLDAPPSYLPNLTVSLPRIGAVGDDGVPVTLRVGNGGRQGIPAGVAVQLFAGDPSTTAPVGSGQTERGLRPGEWTDIVVLWQAAGSGVQATAVVDADDVVVECDEDDNQVTFEMTETLLPDLAIAAGGVSAAGSAQAGQLVPVQITVENVGAAGAPAFSLRLYDGDPSLGIVLAELQAEPLGVGTQRVETLNWDTTGASGSHLIHAVIDSEGALAEVSEANNSGLTTIDVSSATAPDLAAEILTVTPSTVEAGESALMQVEVANRGADLPGGFVVAFRVNNAEAGRVQVPELFVAGAVRTVDFSLITTRLSGTANLEVRLDPDNAISELDEANNRAFADLEVTPSSLAVTVSTDRTTYGPNEDVDVEVTAQNLAAVDRPVVLDATVVDAFGAVVAELADEAVTLPPGATTLDLPWNTGNTLPGTYSVLVEVIEDGQAKAQGNALFNIAGEETTRATLYTNRDVYTPLESVQLFGNVFNDSTNTILSNLEARLAIQDDSGTEVFSAVRNLAALYPGSSAPMNDLWEINNHPAGTYTASLSLRDVNDDLLAFASSLFEVEDSAQTGAGLAGELTAAPSLLGAGAPLQVTWQAENGGNADLDNLQLRIELVRLSDGFVADQITLPQPLAQGESASGELGFDTRGLNEGDFLATLVGVLPGEEVRLDRDAFASGYAVSIGDSEVNEGDGGSSVMTFQVVMSTIFADPVTVDFATFDGSATAGEDYQATSGTVTFAPGEFIAEIDVTVFGDLDPEGDEVFLVRLDNANGVLIGDDQGLGLLRDEEGCGSRNLLTNGDAEEFASGSGPVDGWQSLDAGWQARFGDPTPLSGMAAFAFAGDAAASELTQDVDLSAYVGRIDAGLQEFLFEAFVYSGDAELIDGARLVVVYRDALDQVLATFDSGALLPGSGLLDGQWTAIIDRQVVPAGSRSARVSLEVTDPDTDGAAIYFDRVGLRSLGVPTLEVSSVEILEGDSGSVALTFPVSLSCAAAALEIDYATQDGSATAGADYQAALGTLSLAAGQIDSQVEVTVLTDTIDEADETFTLSWTATANDVVVLDSDATATILDDDGPVMLSIVDLNGTEGDVTADLLVPVTLSTLSGQTVRVDYTTQSGSAVGGDDFTSTSGTLVFAPGETVQSIAVPLIGDLVAEADESFSIELSGPQNGTLDDASASITVFDNDIVVLSVDDVNVVEGDNGSARAAFTVSTSLASTLEVTVDYATADGDALAVDDYTASSGQLIFAAGQRSAMVEVPITGDLVVEPLEFFTLLLSAPVNAVLGDPEAQASILDDDGLLLSVADLTVREGADGELVEAVFQLSVQKAGQDDVTVDFTTVEGSALAGIDYTATSGTAVLAAGSLVTEVRVPLLGDEVDEPAETFGLVVSNIVNGILLDPEATATVIDDDGWHINGNATDLTIPGCVILTPNQTNRRGSAWRTTQVDLSQSWEKTVQVHSGTSSSGGEGITFTFQNSGSTALGSNGQGLGYSGISPSVGTELDSNGGNTGDHMGVNLNGANNHNGHPVVAGFSFENGNLHDLRMVWNAVHQELDVHYRGEEVLIYNRDMVGDTFGGDSTVFWGLTGGTSSRRSLQYFCETEACYGTTADPKISVGDVRRLEGDAGSIELSFPVTLACPSDQPVTVDYATVDDTATAGSDYQAASGSLTFAPGETSKSVTVTVFGDTEVEGDELFFVALSNAVGGTVRYGMGEGSIWTDDVAVVFDTPTIVEGDHGTRQYRLPVRLNAPLSTAVSVSFATRDGSATAGSDYLATSGTMNFAAGSSSQTLVLNVISDRVLEGDETLFIDFNGSGRLDSSSTTLTLFDDDDCGSPNLIQNPGNELPLVGGNIPLWTEVVGSRWSTGGGALEGARIFYPGTVANAELAQTVDVSHLGTVIDGGDLLFSFSGAVKSFNQSNPDRSRIVLEYRAADGTALETFDSGQIANRNVWQGVGEQRTAPIGTRSVRVRLISQRFSGSSNDGYYDALVLRAHPVPTLFTQGDVTVLEGQSQVANQAVFEVQLHCDTGEPVTVDYLTRDGGGSGGIATSGNDYEATFGTLVFQPGERSKTVSVPIFGDTATEGDESFSLEFLSPIGALLEDPLMIATILDDESSLSLGDVTLEEGFEGTVTALVPITLTPASDQIVTVEYTTNDGTATAPDDYLPQTDSVVFQPGETEKFIAIEVVGDIEVESDENFFVDLLESNHAGISDGRGEITILQDDTSLAIGDVQVLEGSSGSVDAIFRVTLSSASAAAVTVDYATSDGSAEAGIDYVEAFGSLTFQPGELEQTITVSVLGDDEVEFSELFYVTLSNVVGGSLGNEEGTGYILDDDDCPSPSWLINGGGDDALVLGEIPGWQVIQGSGWTRRTASPAPFLGSGYLYPGNVALAELAQVVDLSGYATRIDAGAQRFLFEGYLRTNIEASNDLGRFVVEYLDGSGEILDIFDSGEVSTPGTWESTADLRTVPMGTRSARVRLISRRISGSGNTTFYDAISLRSLGTPVLLVDDATVLESDGLGSLDFPVRLSCASEQTVSVDYATTSETATEGVDYTPVSGRLEIPPGETEVFVEVPILGDEEIEDRETLLLDIANPDVAVIFDGQGVGLLVDDESEPAIDLRLSKQVAPFAVRPAGTVDFTLQIHNRGVETATNLVLVDQLPDHVDFVTASDGGTYDGLTREVTWNIASLDPRQFAIRTLTVRGDAAIPEGQTVINIATVADDGTFGADQNPADNTAQEPLYLGDSATPLVEPRQPINLTTTAGVLFGSSSDRNVTYTPNRSGDGNRSTSWFTQDNGSFNRGGNPFWEATLPRDATVSELRMFGNRESANGFDIFRGIFRLYDADDNILYDSGEVGLPGANRDLSFSFEEVERVRRVRFTPTADQGIRSGFSELEMIGFYGDLISGRVPEGKVETVVAAFFDSEPGETHTATIDWGDGTVDVGVVEESGGNGTVTGSHVYPDDAVVEVEICVTDSVNNTGCGSYTLFVENSAPVVDDEGDIDLSTWQVDHYDNIGTQGRANWDVAADGLSVLQRINSRPSIFYGDFPAFGTRITGRIRVETTNDNDFIGFALGYEPGDSTNPDADFLLFDWKQGDQDSSRAGLAVSRITGTSPDVWAHRTSDSLVELARGIQLGRIGWQEFTDYTFTFEFTQDRFRAFVDGELQLDVEGDFADGRFAFYNYSQENVRYSAFGIGAVLVDEGELTVVEAEFTDDGILDTHTGQVTWSDGAVTQATFRLGDANEMLVRGEHTFGDNGEYEAEMCVTDDDGGIGCGYFPIGVLNVRPTVDAGPDVAIGLGANFALPPATFFDPGILDTHTSTIDWGDGSTPEGGTLEGLNGSGTVAGEHLYAAPGVYTAEVCVTDDDGDTGCDQVQITVTIAPELVISKTDSLAVDLNSDGVVNPGEEIEYSIVIDNLSSGVASSVTLDDVAPQHTSMVLGSASTSQGVISSEDPLRVDLGTLGGNSQTVVTFRVRVDSPLAAGVDEVVNQAVISSAELGNQLSDDPDTAELDDPTITPVVGDPELLATKVDSLLIDADGDGNVSPGDSLRYTLTVSNIGDGAASGVLLSDGIPTYTAAVAGSVTSSQGSVLSDDPVSVDLGSLPAGASATVTFDVLIDAVVASGVDEIVNQASIDSDQLETVLSDDPDVVGETDPTVTPLVTTPELDALKTATLSDDIDEDGVVSPGDELLYGITLTSFGNTGATAVILMDLVPENTTIVPGSVEATQDAATQEAMPVGSVLSEDPIEVDLGTLESGDEVLVSFRVRIDDPFPADIDFVVNQALIASAELDDVLSDDPSTDEIDDPTVTPVAQPGQTTVCELLPFDGQGVDDVEWTLSLLGDADQGSATVVDERLHLSGDGTSLYHGLDNGAFYHHDVGSDADYRIEVTVSDFPVDEGGAVRKAALMLRTGLDPLAARVMVTFVPHLPGANPGDPETTGLQFDARLGDGGNAVEIGNTVFGVPLSTRLAIEKRGDVATVYYSVDDGVTWIQGVDATYHGQATIDFAAAGETVLAGVMVASYDANIATTAEFVDFEVCRPDIDPPVDPEDPPVCEDKPLDVLVLLDVSGSMTASFPGIGSKLEAAQSALDRLVVELGSAPSGSRLGLVTASGFRTPAENLAGAFQVISPLTTDMASVNALAQAIDVDAIDPGVPTPAALALKGVVDQVLPQFDPANQPIVVWLSDGVSNIDILGRGPEPYELEELQAISLYDGAGQFLSWGQVGWSGDFNGGIGTFDGEPLANAMFQLERLSRRAPDALIYGVAVQGDGVDLGTFNADLLQYAAHLSGGRSFAADDTPSLVASIVALSNDAQCVVGTASLGGRLWQDRDGDGQQNIDTSETGEPGLATVTVNLFDEGGFGVTSAQADGTGSFVFGQLPAGIYSVQVDASTLPTGDNGLPIDVATYDLDGTATVDTASLTVAESEVRGDVNFGYREQDAAPPAEICDLEDFEDGVLDPVWQFSEIGNADQGDVAEINGALHLTSDGTSLFHGTDNGTLVYRHENGDFRTQVRVTSIPDDVGGPVRKGCLMARSGTGDNDPRVMVCYIPHLPNTTTQALQFDVRHNDGSAEEMADFVINAILPVEMAIERVGDVITVEYSLDGGTTWVQPDGLLGGTVNLDLGSSPLVGMIVASYDENVTTTVAFDDFEVCRPNPDLP